MPIPPDELEQLAGLISIRHDMRDVLRATVFEQLIPAPEPPRDAATLAHCEAIYQAHVAPGGNALLPDADLRVPTWMVLEYLTKERGLLVHGSGDPRIARFEPRMAQDNLVGGDQPRVYAASSGILAGFYAVVDRPRLDELSVIPALNNLYVTRRGSTGELHEAFQFALDYRALPHFPWRTGTVYLLPRDTFVADHGEEQWWSDAPVVPSARLTLQPEDWPLLGHVRGVDFIALLRRMSASLDGLPWWRDPEIYP